MKRVWLPACALLVAITAGCSKAETISAPSATSPSPVASPAPSGPSIYPAPSSSPAPYSPPSPISMQGSSAAHVQGPGGIDVDLQFNTMDPYSFYAGPRADSSLVFTDAQGNTLSLGGVVQKGTFKTSDSFGLALAVSGQPVGPLILTSGDGTCRITVDTATTWKTTSKIEGSFACTGLVARKGILVDATGTFSGSMPSPR